MIIDACADSPCQIEPDVDGVDDSFQDFAREAVVPFLNKVRGPYLNRKRGSMTSRPKPDCALALAFAVPAQEIVRRQKGTEHGAAVAVESLFGFITVEIRVGTDLDKDWSKGLAEDHIQVSEQKPQSQSAESLASYKIKYLLMKSETTAKLL